MAKGKLYIIPINISDSPLVNVLPAFNTGIINDIRHFAVEKVKTSRQFLRKMNPSFPIDESVFYEQDKHKNYDFEIEVIDVLKSGENVGLMSESGYPGIADPGSRIVANAQAIGVKIVPLIGPSSIFLALASSGMNGNGFTFNSYLPKKDPERSQEIKNVLNAIRAKGFAQIFIETPYRNEVIFSDFIKYAPDDLKLCVAFDVTGSNEQIETRSIAKWKAQKFKFDKTPCVFILGS